MRTSLLHHRHHAQTHTLHTLHGAITGDRTSRTARALAECERAWQEASTQAKQEGQPPARALRRAIVAYKLAMPRLDTIHNIRAAIACIAHGIALEVFDGRDGSQLLYAAQVALSLHRDRRRRK